MVLNWKGREMKRIGLIVNPIAGMGGRVGLKGTDGADVLKQARKLGAKPQANQKTKLALEKIDQSEVVFLTAPGPMGETSLKELGLTHQVLAMTVPDETSPADTTKALELMLEQGVDLIVFSGGDGTARQVAEVVGHQSIPVIGIPAGVKIHSSVYAQRPSAAGEMIARFITADRVETMLAEVMDIDEDLFREDVLSAKLYGYLTIPSFEEFQRSKASGAETDRDTSYGIAETVINNMDPDITYFVGPGSTTVPIMELLELPYTLLGFDVVKDGQLIIKDAAEEQLLQAKRSGPIKIILSVIGGQGYLLGRGNQQLSPAVLDGLDKTDFIIVASNEKIRMLDGRPLLVDSGSAQVDELLRGYHRLVVGPDRYYVYPAE